MARTSSRSTDPAASLDDQGVLAFGGLADVLEPTSAPELPIEVSFRPSRPAPVSIREPAQVEDFAFADTVNMGELDDQGPPSSHPHGSSGPVFFDDAASNTQCMTPLAFPLPHAPESARLSTRLRIAMAHLRHGARRSVEEMRELWNNAREIVESDVEQGLRLPPASAWSAFTRRLLALWSCFQWGRADLARAGLIALGVFVVAGVAFGSFRDHRDTTELGAESADVASATTSNESDQVASAEVRAAHTLDQHTGRKIVIRNKR